MLADTIGKKIITLGPKMADVGHCQQRLDILQTSSLNPTHSRHISSTHDFAAPSTPKTGLKLPQLEQVLGHEEPTYCCGVDSEAKNFKDQNVKVAKRIESLMLIRKSCASAFSRDFSMEGPAAAAGPRRR